MSPLINRSFILVVKKAATFILSKFLPRPFVRLFFPFYPKGVITNAVEWVDSIRSTTQSDPRDGPPAWYTDIHESELILYPRRDNGYEFPDNFPKKRIFLSSRSGLFMIRNARIFGSAGFVFAPDGRLFTEFGYPPYQRQVLNKLTFPKPTFLPGTFATICYPSSVGYYHWVHESLPRLNYLDRVAGLLDGIFYPSAAGTFAKQSLVAMGIPSERLLPLIPSAHFICENLYIPQYCGGFNSPIWVNKYLKEKLFSNSDKTEGPFRRIYISRADARFRKLINEPEIMEVLKAQHFEIHRMSELPFEEQAKLFYESKIVCGVHGAGLVNVLFCREGANIVELLPSNRVKPHVYYTITSLIGGRYFDVTGSEDTSCRSDFRRGSIDSDFTVSASDILKVLEFIDAMND